MSECLAWDQARSDLGWAWHRQSPRPRMLADAECKREAKTEGGEGVAGDGVQFRT